MEERKENGNGKGKREEEEERKEPMQCDSCLILTTPPHHGCHSDLVSSSCGIRAYAGSDGAASI